MQQISYKNCNNSQSNNVVSKVQACAWLRLVSHRIFSGTDWLWIIWAQFYNTQNTI